MRCCVDGLLFCCSGVRAGVAEGVEMELELELELGLDWCWYWSWTGLGTGLRTDD